MTSPAEAERDGLVERLQSRALAAREERTATGLGDALAFEAASGLIDTQAAEITRLRAENAGMRKALKPFAALSQRMLDKDIPRHIQDDDSTPVLGSGVAYEEADAVAVTVADLRRAALEQEGR